VSVRAGACAHPPLPAAHRSQFFLNRETQSGSSLDEQAVTHRRRLTRKIHSTQHYSPRDHTPLTHTTTAMTVPNGTPAIPTGQPLADVTKIASSSSAASEQDAEAYLYSNDTRVTGYEPLISPGLLIHEIPVPPQAQRVIAKARGQASAIINGKDDRLLVVVGPCSIHDPEQAKVYAQRLAQSIEKYQKDLVIVMRAYFEKPRTTVGWKGLINDPDINGTFQINRGLKVGTRDDRGQRHH
jgi:hypothetical protein